MPENESDERRNDVGLPRNDDHSRTPRVRFIGDSYRLLFERNPLPMWVFDVKSLYFLAVNEAALAHYGYSRNEFLRMTARDLLPPEDVPQLLDELARVDSATEVIGIWRHLKRDGTLVDAEVRSNEIDFDGHRARLVLAHDVTERLRAERRLRTEYAVTTVLMESPSFQLAVPRLLSAVCEEAKWEYGEVWRTSRDGAALQWDGSWHVPGFDSRALEESSRAITVTRGVGIPGTTWATGQPEWLDELSEGAHFARAAAARALGLRQGISFPITGRRRRVLGVMVFLSCTPRPTDTAFLDLMEDLGHRMGQILEAERTEEVRETTEERFSKAFHENPAAASITRLADGTVIDVNAAFLRSFEYTRDEVIGHSSRELAIWSAPGQRERILEPIARGEPVHGLEETFRTKSGRSWSALVFVEAMSLASEPTILTTLVDVTDLREAQHHLLEAERLASIGRTASFVAHELNTPLTNIALLAAAVRRQTPAPEVLERVDRIDKQRRIASHIIEEILAFTKPTSIHREDTDLAALVRQAVEQADSYRQEGVAVRLELGERPVAVSVDPLKMSQAFVNLVKNAYQATAAGSVTVDLRLVDGAVRVSVRDTGKGVPPEALGRLFEPFFTTKGHGEGVGLGLAFTKAVVEAHGGRIELDSKPQAGTVVVVSLPCAPGT